MSFVKREMERQDAMRDFAQGKLIDAGALSRCEICDEVTDNMDGGEEVTEELLEMFAEKDPEVGLFRSEEEIKEAVQAAIDNAGEDCSCSRHAQDDD